MNNPKPDVYEVERPKGESRTGKNLDCFDKVTHS